MSQSLVKNLIHLVYSTKHRQPWIAKDHRDGLFAYQAGIFKEWDSPTLVIGGMEDHVHALFALSKNHPLKRIAEEVKKGRSKWMKIAGPKNPAFTGQQAVHRTPGRASPEDDVSGRAPRVVSTPWDRV